MSTIPLKLVRGAVIPRDVQTTVRMQPVPEPVVVVVAADTGGPVTPPSEPTYYVKDTFADVDGTRLIDHTGEIGATWTRLNGFGADDDGELVIRDNAMRRPTFDEDTSDAHIASCGQSSMVYPSGTIPPGWTTAVIEFGLIIAANSSNAAVAISEKADVWSSDADFLFEIGNPHYEGSNNIFGVGPGATTTYGTLALAYGPEQAVKLTINGTACELFVDGVSKLTWTRTAQPVEPFGIDVVADGSGEALARLTYYRVSS